MENLKELQEIIKERSKINEAIDTSNSISFWGRHRKEAVGPIGKGCDLTTIGHIIGDEKLVEIVRQFKSLILAELYKKKEEANEKISNYEIVVKS